MAPESSFRKPPRYYGPTYSNMDYSEYREFYENMIRESERGRVVALVDKAVGDAEWWLLLKKEKNL